MQYMNGSGRRGLGAVGLVPAVVGVVAARFSGGQPALEVAGLALAGLVAGSLAGAVAERLLEVERENGWDGSVGAPEAERLTWKQRLPFIGAWWPGEGEEAPSGLGAVPLVGLFVYAWRYACFAHLVPRAWRPERHRWMAVGVALAYAALGWRFGAGAVALQAGVVIAALATAAAVDARTYLIPDEVTLAGALAALAVAPFTPLGAGGALAGALAGAGALYVFGEFGRMLAGSEGSRFARGGGDVKLMAMIGALLGWAGALEVIVAGAFVAAPVGAVVMVRERMRGKVGFTRIPFGPFLAAGALVVLFLGR